MADLLTTQQISVFERVCEMKRRCLAGDAKLSAHKMADLIMNNPTNLRICILYEFLKGNKPFETHKSMMKMFGDEFMGYQEFEFWFMRFAKGNFDLDYDYSLEPKKRQITDLPVDIFEKIGDSLDVIDRNRLRNVSKDIQLLVDDWNPKITEFTYVCFDYWIIVQNSKTYNINLREDERRPDPLPVVMKILKNPKLRLKKLTVRDSAQRASIGTSLVREEVQWKKIEQELRKSSTKLHVNHLTLNYPKGPIDLSLFAPESLEEVSLLITDKSVEKMNEILQSEHYKQLKMLTIRTNLSPWDFPFESFIGIPRFTIWLYPYYSELKVLEFIKKLIKCTQLELFKLEFTTYDYTPTWEPIKEYLSQKEYLVPNFPNIRRYPIRGSTDFYEINLGESSISIERKS